MVNQNSVSPSSLSLLYLPCDRGGLKCPNFLWYCWAAQLHSLTFYFSEKVNPHWVEMESQNIKWPLPSFLYSDTARKLLKQIRNPILKHMVKVWNDVRKYLNESNFLSQFSPVWGNQSFKPGRADDTFEIWASRGPKTICNLYSPQSDVFMSFGEL